MTALICGEAALSRGGSKYLVDSRRQMGRHIPKSIVGIRTCRYIGGDSQFDSRRLSACKLESYSPFEANDPQGSSVKVKRKSRATADRWRAGFHDGSH